MINLVSLQLPHRKRYFKIKRKPRRRSQPNPAETSFSTLASSRRYSPAIVALSGPATAESLVDRVINQDFTAARNLLPLAFVNLLVLDPPYNLTKNYNGHVFRSQDAGDYTTSRASSRPLFPF